MNSKQLLPLLLLLLLVLLAPAAAEQPQQMVLTGITAGFDVVPAATSNGFIDVAFTVRTHRLTSAHRILVTLAGFSAPPSGVQSNEAPGAIAAQPAIQLQGVLFAAMVLDTAATQWQASSDTLTVALTAGGNGVVPADAQVRFKIAYAQLPPDGKYAVSVAIVNTLKATQLDLGETWHAWTSSLFVSRTIVASTLNCSDSQLSEGRVRCYVELTMGRGLDLNNNGLSLAAGHDSLYLKLDRALFVAVDTLVMSPLQGTPNNAMAGTLLTVDDWSPDHVTVGIAAGGLVTNNDAAGTALSRFVYTFDAQVTEAAASAGVHNLFHAEISLRHRYSTLVQLFSGSALPPLALNLFRNLYTTAVLHTAELATLPRTLSAAQAQTQPSMPATAASAGRISRASNSLYVRWSALDFLPTDKTGFRVYARIEGLGGNRVGPSLSPPSAALMATLPICITGPKQQLEVMSAAFHATNHTLVLHVRPHPLFGINSATPRRELEVICELSAAAPIGVYSSSFWTDWAPQPVFVKDGGMSLAPSFIDMAAAYSDTSAGAVDTKLTVSFSYTSDLPVGTILQIVFDKEHPVLAQAIGAPANSAIVENAALAVGSSSSSSSNEPLLSFPTFSVTSDFKFQVLQFAITTRPLLAQQRLHVSVSVARNPLENLTIHRGCSRLRVSTTSQTSAAGNTAEVAMTSGIGYGCGPAPAEDFSVRLNDGGGGGAQVIDIAGTEEVGPCTYGLLPPSWCRQSRQIQRLRCHEYDSMVGENFGYPLMVRIAMGDFIDYIRPGFGQSLCDLLSSRASKQYELFGTVWNVVAADSHEFYGGGVPGLPGRERGFPFWSSSVTQTSPAVPHTGGCGHATAGDTFSCGQSFTLTIMTTAKFDGIKQVFARNNRLRAFTSSDFQTGLDSGEDENYNYIRSCRDWERVPASALLVGVTMGEYTDWLRPTTSLCDMFAAPGRWYWHSREPLKGPYLPVNGNHSALLLGWEPKKLSAHLTLPDGRTDNRIWGTFVGAPDGPSGYHAEGGGCCHGSPDDPATKIEFWRPFSITVTVMPWRSFSN